jgi:carbonic anhydrase
MRMKLRSLKMRELNRGNTHDVGTAITMVQTRSAPTEEGIKALVITCIDFRLIDEAVEYLNSKGYLDNYDEFILAGASLGYNTSLNALNVNPKYSGWDKVLENHIDISDSLHKIKEIIIIDHMDCGAYKAQLNDGKSYSKCEEINKHVENLNIFRNTINSKYSSKYNVKTWIMRLDGTVDVNPTYWQPASKKIKVPINSVIIIGNNNALPNINSVGNIDEPLSTLSNLRYKLLDKDGKELTTSPYVKVQNDGNIWYIQCICTAYEFGILISAEYRLQLDDSLSYVKVKMVVESANDDDVTFIFEKSDYF